MEVTEGVAYRAALLELSNIPRAPRRHIKVARKKGDLAGVHIFADRVPGRDIAIVHSLIYG